MPSGICAVHAARTHPRLKPSHLGAIVGADDQIELATGHAAPELISQGRAGSVARRVPRVRWSYWLGHGVLRSDGMQLETQCADHFENRIAVSYTHLRAHETDSYLVCRL